MKVADLNISEEDNPTHCPFCSGNSQLAWRTTGMRECQKCSLMFRSPVPEQQRLNELYFESWSAPENQVAETGGTDNFLAEQYVSRLMNSLGVTSFSGLRLLDFGAGRGALSAALIQMDAKVVPVDPYGWRYLRSKGLPAEPSLNHLHVGQFDGIVAVDVIEHLLSPWEQLRELRSYVKPDGWIYLATPNRQGLRARKMKGKWEEAQKPGHLYLFSPRSLEAVLRATWSHRFSRLRWDINYSRTLTRKLAHILLQVLKLDGQLRYLAWKRDLE